MRSRATTAIAEASERRSKGLLERRASLQRKPDNSLFAERLTKDFQKEELARRAYYRKAKSLGLNIHEEHLKERTGALRRFERADSKDRRSTKRVKIFPLTEGFR